MKIELRSISHNERLSEETNAYSADLWVDGRKIGHVSNHGHGGCDMFHGDQTAYRAADEWCKANLPPMTLASDPDWSAPTDLEAHCSNLLTRWLIERDTKRTFSKALCFVKPEEPTKFYEYRLQPKKGWDMAFFRGVMQQKHPTAVILNDLPIAEAVDRLNAMT